MSFETRIILKELIWLPPFIAQMTLVMFLIQMFMQLHNIVEAKWLAKFAEGMSGKAGMLSIALGLVFLQTRWGISR